MKKNKTISFSKIITIFSIIITVGGFTFTNNDIIFNKYNVYAISLASTDTNALAKQHSNSVKEQGGAGYIYLTNSKYHIVASIYENEADALKVRCLNEISNEEASLIALEQPAQVAEDTNYGNGSGTPIVPTPTPVKKKKTVSIKSINNAATWQIETEDDVKRYIAELEKKLMNTLEDNTIINIEF